MRRILLALGLLVGLALPVGAATIVHAVTTGGTAVAAITGQVRGCIIINPLTATDQAIGVAEPLYVRLDGGVAGTVSTDGQSVPIPAGSQFVCPTLGPTGYWSLGVSANAVTSLHNFIVIAW